MSTKLSKKNKDVSFVIVHYGHGPEVFKCLDSLKEIHNKFKSAEFLLLDNNEVKKDQKEIKNRYKFIKYFTTKKNLGWGGGRNFLIKKSIGKYIVSIDSDIIISLKSFLSIYKNISQNKKIGLASPLLKNKSGKYTPSATAEMTPLRGIFYLSFLNNYFSKSKIINKFLIKSWNRKTSRFVEVAQFGAFIMKRVAYDQIGGFDEKLFLYFEENDVAKRLKKHGYKIYFDASSKVIHLESKGTPKASDWIKNVFKNSRMHYFKKHYGLLPMLLVEFFARISKESLLVFAIILIGTILRFYKFSDNLIFNGEMGTDYLNVKSMLDGERNIFLGPRTSHEWFFIPPLSYWLYGLLFLVFGSSPIVINIFWGVVGVLAIYLTYYYLKKLFDSKVAMIASFLVAVSPAWLAMTRDARYNAPAAILFLPYLYYLKISIDDKGKSLFKLGLILGLMMSFFPSPILLIPASILSFVIFKVKPALRNILLGLLGFIIPNLFYIFNLESVKNIILWVPYRIFGSVGLYPKNTLTPEIVLSNFKSLLVFIYENFLPNFN